MNLPTFTCPECGRIIDIRDLKSFPPTQPGISNDDSITISVSSDYVELQTKCGPCWVNALADVNDEDSWSVPVDRDEFLRALGVLTNTEAPDLSHLSLNRDPETALSECDE